MGARACKALAEVRIDRRDRVVNRDLHRAGGPGLGRLVPLMANPARAGAVVAIVVISVAALFTSGNISSGRREDTKNRVIRHPSYLSLLLGLFGWAQLFRSGIGLLVSLLLLPPLVARMNSEEALLESEFGEAYSDYRRRTWRLIPFVY